MCKTCEENLHLLMGKEYEEYKKEIEEGQRKIAQEKGMTYEEYRQWLEKDFREFIGKVNG